MNPCDDFAKEHLLRVSAIHGVLSIFACQIDWHGPHTPVETWVKVIELRDNISSKQLDLEIKKVLANQDYFKVCSHCNTVNIVGHMIDDEMCQACAESVLGIVY